MNVKKLAALGLLAAISVVGVALIHLPIFPQVAFLEYDPADIPIFIATFAFGPLSGIVLTIVVSVIQGFTVSAKSGLVGIAMHIIATGSFVLCAGTLYKRNKSRKRAYLALAAGVAVMTIIMALWNYLITPLYMGIPRESIVPLMPFIVSFNFIKAGINALVTAVVYKKVHNRINKFLD